MFLFALSRAEGHPRRLFRSLDRDGNRLPSDGRLRQVAPQFLPTSVRSVECAVGSGTGAPLQRNLRDHIS